MAVYRLPTAIEHPLPNWPLVDFRKKHREGDRSVIAIGLFFLLGNECFFLFQARTGHAGNHVKQSRQEETQEEKEEKQFRFAVYEEEETQTKNDYDNRMVLSKGNNATHES